MRGKVGGVHRSASEARMHALPAEVSMRGKVGGVHRSASEARMHALPAGVSLRGKGSGQGALVSTLRCACPTAV